MAPISIRGVQKTYGKNAVVHGIDLEINSGEFVVILGPSGCGKSTLLRMIAGLEAISGGEIAIDGKVVNQLEPRERGCAMVFQNYALYPHMSVAQNIGYSLKVAGMPKAERLARVTEVARSVGLEAFLDRKPMTLSGGQRQRVAMGRAMIRQPKVFLFDEPLSNLDAQLRVQMRAEIRRLHRQLGTTSVFVTHDQAEAMTLADRLIVMRGGFVEQVGTPSEVYNRPASRFVAGFVGSPPMNLIEGSIDADGAFMIRNDKSNALQLDRKDLAGQKVVFGIRPEALSLASAAGPGTFSATVDFVEEFGAARVIHLDWDGQAMAVALSVPTDIMSGRIVNVAVNPAEVHLYSVETGKRLDAEQAPAAMVKARADA